MPKFVIIYSHESLTRVLLAKAKLEEAEIPSMTKDELSAQVINYLQSAIGGVKLMVAARDEFRALEVLKQAGFVENAKTPPPEFLQQLDRLTAKLPVLGDFILEKRLMILLGLLLFLVLFPILYYSLSI